MMDAEEIFTMHDLNAILTVDDIVEETHQTEYRVVGALRSGALVGTARHSHGPGIAVYSDVIAWVRAGCPIDVAVVDKDSGVDG